MNTELLYTVRSSHDSIKIMEIFSHKISFEKP